MKSQTVLNADLVPRRWYNIMADATWKLEPMLNPGTQNPVTDDELHAFFPKEMVYQENTKKRWISIPETVRDLYTIWRPTPLIRCARLERALKTPARIYMKWEGVSPSGSHKPNTALAQAYYHQKEGKERLTTETGAGQWGSALSFAASIFDMQCTVYMGRGDYEQKPFRKSLMRAWGAECIPSPSTRTQVGKDLLARNPDHKGSLMISISEAIWDAMHTKNTGYSIGSLTNNVLIHQTVIGLEAQQQFKQIDDYPDVVIGCVGGGSNFGGVSFPFIGEKLRGERPDLEIIASEPASCPTMTKGVFAYDFGDSSGLTPLIKMLTLGHDFMPPAIYAGGLRLHCISPIVSKLVMDKTVRAVAYNQVPVFDAATLFARSEGYVVAPETAHAVKAVIEAARECKRTKEAKTILFNGSGHGNFDLNAYDRYFDGKLENYPYPAAMAKETIRRLPKVV